jgi:alpha-galactosidase
MPIIYDRPTRTFFLHGPRMTYAIGVGPLGSLLHLYWGPRLRGGDLRNLGSHGKRIFSVHPDPKDQSFSFDTLGLEYPVYGRSDFRSPALQITLADGSRILDLVYAAHRISPGKPTLEGLPAVYVEKAAEGTTLEIDLIDHQSGLKVTLLYTIYAQRDALSRSVKISNGGAAAVSLNRVLSASLDLHDSDFDLLQLSGAWCRERDVVRQPLRRGLQSVESRRGTSSHQQNPFLALLRPGTGESHGEVYGFSLIYSGNFLAQAEVDQYASTRVQIGLTPFDFSWRLESGASFQAPEAVLVFSVEGLNGMSQVFHDLYRERLARGIWRDRERPILFNNWEATYFDFNAAKLEKLARHAKQAGMELFVLDSGWFGRGADDATSVGDWTVNLKKLPRGLKELSRKIHRIGLKFGLWFEPESVSPGSDLYRTHPDWCLHVPGRTRSVGRNTLVLDLSRPEVCDWIVEAVGKVLTSAQIDYVKWDMNRYLTEVGSIALPPERQAETAHRHVLGLYNVLERLIGHFPRILFEGCSGGGGRFDPGMLHYMPQIWTSDNSDAISRLKIQYGTSLVYPPIAMTAHVSASPNHQVGRITSLKIRGDVAMSGNFGYELDLGPLDREEQREIHRQVAFYRRHRKLIQFGRFFRLRNPFQENGAAWTIVSRNQKQALVWNIEVLNAGNSPQRFLRLQGLDQKSDYRVAGTKDVFGGDLLHSAGLPIPLQIHDFQSTVWELKTAR